MASMTEAASPEPETNTAEIEHLVEQVVARLGGRE
jgi:hypothetical protein